MSQLQIAIVGMDCIFPGAGNLDQFHRVLLRGDDCIRPIPPNRLNGLTEILSLGKERERAHWLLNGRGGFLPGDIRFCPVDYQVMPQIVPHSDPDQFLMLKVADRALSNAGVKRDDPIRKRCDLMVGRGGYMTNQMSELFLSVELKSRLMAFLEEHHSENIPRATLDLIAQQLESLCPSSSVDNISTCIPNLTASRTANRLNLQGAAYTVDGACSSSLLAVEQAIQRLRNNDCDLAIAAGIHLLQTPCFWSIFQTLDSLSKTHQIRPFDRDADGLLIGEGVGAVVLKRLSDAVEAGDRIYAVIQGIGISNDGNQTSVLTPSTPGQVEALRRAYAKSQIDPDSIDYLEAHGTATPVGDAVEIETIRTIFGDRRSQIPCRALGSVKSMIGHTMPAAGMASLIKAVLSVSHQCLFPSLHCENPHEALSATPFYVNPTTRPWFHTNRFAPRRAAVNSFGFGGVNCHLILEQFDAHRCGVPKLSGTVRYAMSELRPTELFLFSAQDHGQLIDQLGQRLDSVDFNPSGPVRLVDLASQWNARVNFDFPVKLALIVRDLEELRDRLSQSINRRFGSDSATEGEFFTDQGDTQKGGIAGIFPGLGFPGLIGNYPAHLIESCLHFPELREEFERIETRDGHSEDAVPTSIVFCPPSNFPPATQLQLKSRLAPITNSQGERTIPKPFERNIAAACVTASNLISWKLLEKLEIPVDMVCGQSQGELAALCAAGILDRDELLPLLWLDRSEEYTEEGCLAILACGEEPFQEFAVGLTSVSAAIHVAPQMLIIGGASDDVACCVERAKKAGVIASLLPYPPIHTGQLRHLRQSLTDEFAGKLHFGKPKVQVYSSVTAEVFPTCRDEIWELMLSNVDRPVRFWQSIWQMYEDGARIFVQVGGGSMSANIKSILPARDAIAVAVDVDHRVPITQIQNLCATLFVNGVRFRPEYLLEYADARPINGDASGMAPTGNQLDVPLRMDWAALSSGIEYNAAPTAALPFGDWPFIGSLTRTNDNHPREIVNEISIDLQEHCYLHDHALVDEGSGKPIEARWAVMPVAMCIEIMCETAAAVCLESKLLGVRNVQAMRWLDFQSASVVQLTVVAKEAPRKTEPNGHLVTVRIKVDDQLICSADVLFGQDFSVLENIEPTPWMAPRPWPVSAAECYAQRHMFHGPQFQCVRQLEVLADNGLVGKIELFSTGQLFASLPEPSLLNHPVTLDGILQLIGIWSIVHGKFALPSRIGSLTYCAPQPSAGSMVTVRVVIKGDGLDVTRRALMADVDVFDEQGQLWLRMIDVQDWTFDYTPEFQDTLRLPTHFHVAQIVAGSAGQVRSVRVERTALRQANLEWVACLYLHADEQNELEQITLLPKKWEWLLTRIAVKDAIRLRLRGGDCGEMLHPAMMKLTHSNDGDLVRFGVEDYTLDIMAAIDFVSELLVQVTVHDLPSTSLNPDRMGEKG